MKRKMIKSIFILIGTLFSLGSFAVGVPTFDLANSQALAETDIPVAEENLFRLKNENCIFAGKTIKKSKQFYLDIKEAVCKKYTISLNNKYVKYDHHILEGEVVDIPVGIIDFIAEQIKEVEDLKNKVQNSSDDKVK